MQKVLYMKKILTLITSALVISGSSAFAWVGGPWSNNSYSQTTTGTYQAVMYMANGVGLARFSDDATSAFSQVNASVIFHQGTVYTGQCFGTADRTSGEGSGSVIGVINASSVTPVPEGEAIPFVTGSFNCKITTDAPIMRFFGQTAGNPNDGDPLPREDTTKDCILYFSDGDEVALKVFGAQISYTIVAVAQ